MITTLALLGFGIGALCAGVRLVLGPTIPDRVAALDVLVLSAMGVVAVDAADRGVTTGLPVLVVLAVIGFVATVAASRFIERAPS